jgi:hypothetical protein
MTPHRTSIFAFDFNVLPELGTFAYAAVQSGYSFFTITTTHAPAGIYLRT